MRYLYAILVGVFILGCKGFIQREGVLVPRTVDQNPALPQREITVAGKKRRIHLQTFGDPQDSLLFILHGGPGADHRVFLPLRALSDKYFVVMWDQRGSGLSERIPKEEISLDSYVEEVEAVRQLFGPERRITLIGHSWGGMLAMLYAQRFPQWVKEIALLEPGPLTSQVQKDYEGAGTSGAQSPFFSGWFASYAWINDILVPNDHEASDYKFLLALNESNPGFYCDKSGIGTTPFWRFGAYVAYHMSRQVERTNYDFVRGYAGDSILILVGACSKTLGRAFQEPYQLPLLPKAFLREIPQAGHYMTAEQPDAVLTHLRIFLKNYR